MRLLLPLLLLASQAAVPMPFPLVNPDFSVPFDPDWALPAGAPDRHEVTNPVLENVGSALPGATEAGADHPAAAWTFRTLRGGMERPESTATWEPGGYVRVAVSEADEGSRTPALSQAVGQRNHLGVWKVPDLAILRVATVTGSPVTLRALYAPVEDPHVLRWSEPATLAPGGPYDVRLPFPAENATLGTFHVSFAAPDGEGHIRLDRVHLVGTGAG